MRDQRAEALAQILVRYSTKVKKSETVVIQSSSTAEPLVQSIYEEVLRAGASRNLGAAMSGIEISELGEQGLIQHRGW